MLLYDRVRPAGSENTADPPNTPVAELRLATVYELLVGVPASQSPLTVTVWPVLLTPLEAVIVNVSTVELVAD